MYHIERALRMYHIERALRMYHIERTLGMYHTDRVSVGVWLALTLSPPVAPDNRQQDSDRTMCWADSLVAEQVMFDGPALPPLDARAEHQAAVLTLEAVDVIVPAQGSDPGSLGLTFLGLYGELAGAAGQCELSEIFLSWQNCIGIAI